MQDMARSPPADHPVWAGVSSRTHNPVKSSQTTKEYHPNSLTYIGIGVRTDYYQQVFVGNYYLSILCFLIEVLLFV